MSERTTRDGGEQGGERAGDRTRSGDSVRRRTFLKTTAAGAVAAGVGLSVTGSAAGQGIPTPWLHRDGNLIKDPSGNEVILRGVNLADPKRINVTAPARGKNAEQVIDLATDESEGWHSRIVRLPVQPGDIANLTPVPNADVQVYQPVTFTKEQLRTYCEEHLDAAVQRCKERGAYCIVDYHRHWGSGSLPWDDPELSEEANMFWEVVAPRYADESHVIYEVYNEPTSPQLGESPVSNEWSAGRWRDWKSVAQPWVDTIREAADNLTIIGSPAWSQYPEGSLVEEFDGDDLGYTYHIYPGHSISDQDQWDEHEGENGEGVEYCWQEVPLFATEFGWGPNSSYPTNGTTTDFGDDFLAWMEDKPIHWTAWCFDPIWQSPMFERAFPTDDATDAIGKPYTNAIPAHCEDLPCEWSILDGENMGERIRTELEAFRDQDLPTGGDATPTDSDPVTPTDSDPVTPTDTGDAPPAVGENDAAPTDPDGDGLYEDVNGNGDGDLADAVDLYQNRGADEVTGHVDAYDFSGNDEVDLADVVQLYQENTN